MYFGFICHGASFVYVHDIMSGYGHSVSFYYPAEVLGFYFYTQRAGLSLTSLRKKCCVSAKPLLLQRSKMGGQPGPHEACP